MAASHGPSERAARSASVELPLRDDESQRPGRPSRHRSPPWSSARPESSPVGHQCHGSDPPTTTMTPTRTQPGLSRPGHASCSPSVGMRILRILPLAGGVLALVLLVRHFGLASLTEALTRITWWQFAAHLPRPRRDDDPGHAGLAVHARRQPARLPQAPGGAVRGAGGQRGHGARRRRRGGDQGVAPSPGAPLRGQRALVDPREDGGGGGPGLAPRHGDPGGLGDGRRRMVAPRSDVLPARDPGDRYRGLHPGPGRGRRRPGRTPSGLGGRRSRGGPHRRRRPGFLSLALAVCCWRRWGSTSPAGSSGRWRCCSSSGACTWTRPS